MLCPLAAKLSIRRHTSRVFRKGVEDLYCMLCPLAVVDRPYIHSLSPGSYGILCLSSDTIQEQVKALAGCCKVSLFLSRGDCTHAFVGDDSIEIVLCEPGVPVSAESLSYGVALLRRRMPIRLSPMITSLTSTDTPINARMLETFG
jgi:hypothetical protein